MPTVCALQSTTYKNLFPTFSTRRRPVRAQIESAVAAGFRPAEFLTPGWEGGSLTSRPAMRYVRLLETLCEDVRLRLCAHDFNRSLKLGIYNEFLTFARDRGLDCVDLADLTSFWRGIAQTHERPVALQTFLDLYCARVAVITLFKLRFIRVLAQKSNLEVGPKAAYNPNHWLSQVFQAGTRRELKAQVMECNVFSWYRPGDELGPQVAAWMNDCDTLSITELIKHASPRVQDQHGQVYSHALSHVNFGLFLNSLLINFPLWVETWDPASSMKFHTPDELEIISCKYSGEYLESLAHSHWLAQDNNKDMKWDQILCPDFKGAEFESGPFLKIFNELQFLTFLAGIAPLQGSEPVSFISKVMGGHYQNLKGTRSRQLTGFDTPFVNSTYDRTVLNLCRLPKNNPYHWMMAQIHAEEESLKPGGYLFVLASKSLFAPSQKDRFTQLLKGFELKAVFEMENLKGKGELGSWLYVFRKRTAHAPLHADVHENVGWFRLTGEIPSFQDFSEINDVLRGFYLAHLTDMPALWQHEWNQGTRLEFFQDALLDGTLIHSAHEDQSRITHPRFFRSLLSTCVPLSSVFDLIPIEPEEWSAPGALGLGLRRESSTFIVVDFRNVQGVKAELFPAETFRSVYYDRGASQCHYFHVAPRHNGMDPNILRQYFTSTVGQQLLGLTFAVGTKVKGQLGKMLVPKWFLRGEFLPESLRPALELFHTDAAALTTTHPDELRERFQDFQKTSHSLFPRYACDVMSALSRFVTTLDKQLQSLHAPRPGATVNFLNPLLQAPLANLTSTALFPSHADIFTEFVPGTSPIDMEASLTEVHLRSVVEGDLRSWVLELGNDRQVMVRLHGEQEILQFAQFILQGANGMPVGRVLKAIRLPRQHDLQQILSQGSGQTQVLEDLRLAAQQFIDDSFRLQMMERPAP
jgi:hypothetical protein